MRSIHAPIASRGRVFPADHRFLDPQLILETMPDSVCMVDRDWTIIYLNERALADLRSSLDVVGEGLWDAFPILAGTDFEKAVRRAMAHGVATRGEAYYEPISAWFVFYAYPLPQGLLIYFRDVTPKKQQHAAYRASEERYRRLFETLTQGVILHDASGAVIEANPAAERILGLSLAQLRNIHIDDPGKVVDEYGEPLSGSKHPSMVALRTGRSIDGTMIGVINPTLNERRWLNVHAVPVLCDGKDKPDQVYALFADVTLRKRAELELLASEARLSRITQNLPVVIFDRLLSRDGTISYPYYKANGHRTPDSGSLDPQSPLWTDVHPDDRQSFAEEICCSAEELSLLAQEFRLVGADGTWRWLLTKGVPRRLDNGDTLWECIGIDITEQKRIEAELRTREAELRRSQDHFARAQRVAGIGSAEYDFRTREWIWSDELYRISGVKKGSVHPSRESMLELLHPEDRVEYRAFMDHVFRGEAVPPIDVRIVRPDGGIRTTYREVEIIRDETGATTGIVVTMQDITDLRRSERERELLKQELLHAQRMDMLGRLAGGIAHDVNNTLVPVIGLSEALLKALPPNSPDAEALSIMRDAGLRAKGLVQQILTFSRREAPNREPVDLERFLGATIRFLRATVPTTIVIEQQLQPVPTILADAAQLHQVMINLITNAVDAIGGAKGKIDVLLSVDGSGVCAQISVIDNGCGVDKGVLDQIFEPFFTTKSVDKGTGLGLSVVYGIVSAHDGQIKVASEVGKGTRFDIFLPIVPGRNYQR